MIHPTTHFIKIPKHFLLYCVYLMCFLFKYDRRWCINTHNKPRAQATRLLSRIIVVLNTLTYSARRQWKLKTQLFFYNFFFLWTSSIRTNCYCMQNTRNFECLPDERTSWFYYNVMISYTTSTAYPYYCTVRKIGHLISFFFLFFTYNYY